MTKAEILEKSRRENNNHDLPELDAAAQAGNLAGRVGACVCCVISFLSLRMADILLFSPWAIYFSILGTHYLVKYRRLKRSSDLVLAVLYYSMGLLAFAFFLLRLVRVKG